MCLVKLIEKESLNFKIPVKSSPVNIYFFKLTMKSLEKGVEYVQS